VVVKKIRKKSKRGFEEEENKNKIKMKEDFFECVAI